MRHRGSVSAVSCAALLVMGDIFALQSRPVTPSIHLSEKAEPLLWTSRLVYCRALFRQMRRSGRQTHSVGGFSDTPIGFAKVLRAIDQVQPTRKPILTRPAAISNRLLDMADLDNACQRPPQIRADSRAAKGSAHYSRSARHKFCTPETSKKSAPS